VGDLYIIWNSYFRGDSDSKIAKVTIYHIPAARDEFSSQKKRVKELPFARFPKVKSFGI